MEKLSAYFQENPRYACFIPALFGLYFLYMAFYRLDKAIEGDGLNHTSIITRAYNLFGYKGARIVTASIGIILLLLAVAWFFLF